MRNVRSSRSRRAPSSRLRESEEYADKDVGTQSAPNTRLTRHKSTSAVVNVPGQDKGKHTASQQVPRRVSPRAEPSSSASLKNASHRSTFEPFAMWGPGGASIAGSGRKSRRGSSNGSPVLALDSLQVPYRGPPRVGSPQPPTPNSTGGTSYPASQVSSPVSEQSPSQPTPPERPLSRLSSLVMRWLGRNTPTPSSTSAYSAGPSPQKTSTSSLVPVSSVTLAQSSSTVAAFASVGSAAGRQIRRDLMVRRSEDAFQQLKSRQSNGSEEPLSLAMRAASWGEVRPSEDLTSLYSGEKGEEALDQETMLLGAGGVAQSPVLSIPTGSGVLSTVSSSVSLGPPILSAAQALLLSRRENNTEPPSVSDPASHDLQRQCQYRPHHQHTMSPLAQSAIDRGEFHRNPSYSSSLLDEESDEGSPGQRTPSELNYHHQHNRANLQRNTSLRYREEDEESSDSEEENIPLEVRTRRPSASVDLRPRPPSPPRRKQSQRSERTLVCT